MINTTAALSTGVDVMITTAALSTGVDVMILYQCRISIIVVSLSPLIEGKAGPGIVQWQYVSELLMGILRVVGRTQAAMCCFYVLLY